MIIINNNFSFGNSMQSQSIWDFFWQTLHKHTEEGTDPSIKRLQLKWVFGAKANRETECVQCPVEHIKKTGYEPQYYSWDRLPLSSYVHIP